MRNQKVDTYNYKETLTRNLRVGAMAIGLAFGAGLAHAHGDVTPQAVDVSTLKPLGPEWQAVNPYRDDKEAIRIGDSAFNQNCARCHGLGAVSGGIAPDLRKLDIAPETDEYFLSRIRNGVTRNGAVYMPPFEGMLSQEAMWAIKAWLETVREK
ncbi:cytochrome c-550 PedF [Aromatoleum diolicum]|uniref:Cytochrome c-550 PedF n=1 Tax=Aromatoleum diolicum TaxID=75796 RepID=A0ABX1Q7Y6_9RHOO|nr:cytochrome c-550 PedF [Aromatoleum diolicum]NMG73531.1 cytochrome c-550 PedF [Aromatoleum diolicum]